MQTRKKIVGDVNIFIYNFQTNNYLPNFEAQDGVEFSALYLYTQTFPRLNYTNSGGKGL